MVFRQQLTEDFWNNHWLKLHNFVGLNTAQILTIPGLRGGKNKKTVFWLSIWKGFFKVTIYVPEKAREDILSLPLDKEVKCMIASSQQMGKLPYFPLVFDLCSDEMFEAVLLLAEFRKNIK
ncbi:MAG: DUF3788 family protein [Eubacteriales bacterium]|nr:DUF3788 family protein [Eubacteriales bacterium]